MNRNAFSQQITLYVQNLDYANKEAVYEHLMVFMTFNADFYARTARQKDPTSQLAVYSFIELVGYILIGNLSLDLSIAIPDNYPNEPPIFMLLLNQEYHKVNEMHQGIQQKQLVVNRDGAGLVYIILNFPFVGSRWTLTKKNINQAYQNMKLSIDNPPLIIRKNIPNENNVKVMFESKVHNDALDRILNDSFSKISALEDSKSQMSEALKKVEYCKHRIDFIKRNLPILIKELKNVCVNIDKHIEQVKYTQKTIKGQGNFIKSVDISEKDSQKLVVIAERESLKQMHQNYFHCLSDKLLDRSIDFNDQSQLLMQRKIMKVLFQKMFNNQCNYLLLVAE